MGSITVSKWSETKNFLLKLISLFLFWEMKAIPCKKLPRNWRSRTTLCTTPFTDQRKLALTRIERGVGGPGVQLSKRTSTLVSSLRNRRLSSPQLAASLIVPANHNEEKTVFSCANIIAKGFSNDQLAFWSVVYIIIIIIWNHLYFLYFYFSSALNDGSLLIILQMRSLPCQ